MNKDQTNEWRSNHALSGCLKEDKNNKKFYSHDKNMVVDSEERCLFTKGSKCSDLTGKILVFCHLHFVLDYK